MAVASVVDTLLMVLAFLNSLTSQLVAVVILGSLVALLAPPLLDVFVAATTALADLSTAQLALSRVMHDSMYDAIQELINVDALIVHGVHELRNNPSHHARSTSTSDLVENLWHGQKTNVWV